ncbi:Nicastrin-domain-containing protein [Chytriomyces sp. MP71]|nr:Nicastrin-domain-containing protein [Chytriomyces sp. MP71]
MSLLRLAALLWAAAAATVHAQNTYIEGGIYQQLQAFGAVRMLNASGMAGPGGSATSGVVYQIASTDDLASFLAFSPPFVRFTPILPFALFSPTVVDQLRASNKLAGIIVVQKNPPNFPVPPFDSPDDVFPNYQYSLYANASTPPYAWNPKGNSMLYKSLDFPVFVMPQNPNDLTWQQSIGTLLQAAQYNADRQYQTYPLYSIELSEFMYASVDAVTCLRRGWCSPAGSTSVWSTFSKNLSGTDARKSVVVSAQLDSNGFFKDFVNSAATTVSGYVTLLAVAQALSQNQKSIASLPSDIIFTFFSAEAFGFAGSQRFVQDISKPFTCIQSPANANSTTNACRYPGAMCQNPCHITTDFTQINLDKISHIVELSQVSGLGLSAAGLAAPRMYLHVDDDADADTLALVKVMSGKVTVPAAASAVQARTAGDVSVGFGPAFAQDVQGKAGNNRLPPSSAMAFLAKRKIPAIVVGDFQNSFTNPYYNSIFDDGSQITPQHYSIMCGVATQTARSVFQLAGGSATDAAQFNANCSLVAELFTCFNSNATCSLFHSIYTGQTVPYANQYTGFFDNSASFTNVPGFLLFYLLANYTAYARTPNACDSTQANPSCSDPAATCVAGTCVLSATSTHAAYGTGIEMDYETGSYAVVDARKGSWVQSSYNATNIRVRTFLVSSPQYQGMQVGVGVAITLVVTAATYYIQRLVDGKFK